LKGYMVLITVAVTDVVVAANVAIAVNEVAGMRIAAVAA
ncbi:hypothetical protein A2U01_0079177, partial [Trifolium medium]|nr:hypothetical protein [Trifolium medium]